MEDIPTMKTIKIIHAVKKIYRNTVFRAITSLVAAFLLVFLCVGSCTYIIVKEVEKRGGVRQIVVDIGKEIKSIEQEIDNEG